LRDYEEKEFFEGKGVMKAVDNVNEKIADEIVGLDAWTRSKSTTR
jgi:enolase